MPRITWDNLDERRRERVLLAAMTEFGRRGYSGASLNVIAREAEVAKGSLFQYFEDKFDLFSYVAEQTSLTIYAALAPYLDRRSAELSFSEHFAQLVEMWMEFMDTHPLERGVTAATNLELDSAVRISVREPVHRLYTQALRPMFSEAIAAGELDAGTDLEALLSMTILLLPHLALAPFEPGFDSAIALYDTSRRVRNRNARRLVQTVLASATTEVSA